MFLEDCKVLGLTWDKLVDTIIINFKDIRSRFVEKPNKWSMLQSIASIYDPLSLICPITVKMKNLFQIVCASKIAWDKDLPDDVTVAKHFAGTWRS